MAMVPSELRPIGELALDRLCAQAAQFGVDLPGLHWESARLAFQRDPSTGSDALVARWVRGARNIEITLRPDGHVYGECDLLVDHPLRPGWWMDVLAIWGRPPRLRCEPTLIKKPD